jgi:protein involved in sex pheromone biosynthesis
MKKNLIIFGAVILMLCGCQIKLDYQSQVVVVDVEGNSLAFRSHGVVIANSIQGLVRFLLDNDYKTVIIESAVKLTGQETADLIYSIEAENILIASFIVPISEPPGKIDLKRIKGHS